MNNSKKSEAAAPSERANFAAELVKAERWLAARDARLGALIERHGPCRIRPERRYLAALVRAVIAQQLSAKAADAIYQRFLGCYEAGRFPRPAEMLATPDAELRAIGLSAAKAAYIKDLAARAEAGELRFRQFRRLSDEDIIARLTRIRGVGVWTAHMFLIFSLGRLDVLPVGDLGVRRGIQQTYELAALPDAGQMARLADAQGWRPYRSVAAWYFWRSLENQPLQTPQTAR